MERKLQRIGITSRSDIPCKEETILAVYKVLESREVKIFTDPRRCSIHALQTAHYQSFNQLDAIIILGGDGTILRTVREMNMQGFFVPMIAINRGTLGFLTELTLDDMHHALPDLLEGKGIMDERHMLSVTAKRGKEILWNGEVLNDAVIAQGAIARLIDLEVSINKEPLTTFNADGLILATPTGSTAYSLSAGGPIVHPKLHASILTPINPHSFSQKPLIIPGESVIETTISIKENKFQDLQVSLTLDGQEYITLRRDDRVLAMLSQKSVQFMRKKEDTFYETLRNKLKWGEGIESKSIG